MRARARGAPLPNPTPFPTSLPLALVVNPRGQRCTAHAHPPSVAAKACVRHKTSQARREREQIIPDSHDLPARVRLRRPCNGSCQAEGVVTRERARSTDPRFHARTQQPAGAAIDPSGSISCASDAAAAALADRAESESMPRGSLARFAAAAHRDGWARPMWGESDPFGLRAQRDVPAAAAAAASAFSLCLGTLGRMAWPPGPCQANRSVRTRGGSRDRAARTSSRVAHQHARCPTRRCSFLLC